MKVETQYYCMTLNREVKDRQQEVRAVLVASHYIGDQYMALDFQYMFDILLITLLSGLFIDIKHIKITQTETKRT